MLENRDKRYNEPKHISEIIKDMKMDPENIERQMKIKLSSKQFAEETIRNLEKYVDVVDKINPLYTEVTKLIISIDKYYTQERSDL